MANHQLVPETYPDMGPSQAGSLAPQISIKRYGRPDYENFDSGAGSFLTCGSRTLGRVTIDCKYRWQESHFGVLGHQDKPAAILYMDLAFHQPQGCRLKSAIVYITLSAEDAFIDFGRTGFPRWGTSGPMPTLHSDYAVQISEHFGPKHIKGHTTSKHEIKMASGIPTVAALGFEVGGMGVVKGSYQRHDSQWSFRGQLRAANGGQGMRTLAWELRENLLDDQETNNNEYHTGFAFEHSGRPTYMRVEIDGQLQSKAQNFKAKFSTRGRRGEDKSCVTKINFEPEHHSRQRLEPIAYRLDDVMREKNFASTARERPSSVPAALARTPAMEQKRPRPSSDMGFTLVEDGDEEDEGEEAEGLGMDPGPLEISKYSAHPLGFLEESEEDDPDGEELVKLATESTLVAADAPEPPLVKPSLQPSHEEIAALMQIPGVIAVLKFISLLMRSVGIGTKEVASRKMGPAWNEEDEASQDTDCTFV